MTTNITRRAMIRTAGLGTACMVTGLPFLQGRAQKHIITLSFDDGFEKSSFKTAEIFEKYGLSACINVISTAHLKQFNMPNEYHAWKAGDFQLWNELQARGHEIMPHSYDHQDLSAIPFEEARDSIRKCMDTFKKELQGFEAGKSVYNFAYNRSTPEIEKWLEKEVLAFRTGGPAINPLPYPGQKKLTCISHGPENIDRHLADTIDTFLTGDPGWFIYNTHGLDEEGWGPVSSGFLDELLDRLTKMNSVEVLPAGKALSGIH